jgi:hypothetical protein
MNSLFSAKYLLLQTHTHFFVATEVYEIAMSDFGFPPEMNGYDEHHHKLDNGDGTHHLLKTKWYDETGLNSKVHTVFMQDAGKRARNWDQSQEKAMIVTTFRDVRWVIETDIEAPYNELPIPLTEQEKDWVKTVVKKDLDRREQNRPKRPTVSVYGSDVDGNKTIVSKDDDYSGSGTNVITLSGDAGDPTFTGPVYWNPFSALPSAHLIMTCNESPFFVYYSDAACFHTSPNIVFRSRHVVLCR